MRKGILGPLMAALLLLPLAAALAAPEKVKYANAAALKEMLNDPQLLIIDVRTPNDWNGSKKKIMGAQRREPGKVAVWGMALPPGRKIVLYCA